MLSIKELRSVFYSDLIKRKKDTPFIVFVSFLISFIVARLAIYVVPGFNISFLFIDTYHIHHFFYGLAFIIASNWLALMTNKRNVKRVAAGMFGIGLGGVVDEIGLLLTCGTAWMECNYYARISYDVAIFIVGVFLVMLFFESVYHRFRFGKTYKTIFDYVYGKNN